MIPREHGAWSMMIQPFLCAAILARQWHWSLIAAAIAVVAAFTLREPLVVLGRQKYVWTTPHPESAVARQWAVGLALALAAAAALLASRWGLAMLLAIGAGAFALTLLAVYMTVNNRQRSWWLQMLSAAGLTSSCLAASLSATTTIPAWCWWLWGVSALHAFAGILVVHARLDARIAAKAKRAVAERFRRPAIAAQVLLLAFAIACFFAGPKLLAAALCLSAAVHSWDLATIHQSLDTKLTIVGIRALTLSLCVSILTVVALWH